MFDLASQLTRPGLDPDVRILVRVAVTVWRADWSGLSRALDLAVDRCTPRNAVEETLLQCVLFCGFPRAIAAFGVLAEHWPTGDPAPGPAVAADDRAETGRRLFDGVYGKNSETVRRMLHEYHPELHDFVLEEAYGRVLGRPALPPRDRELIAVGALAVMEQVPQLVAHARGALAFGADLTALREVLLTALDDPVTVDAHLRRIERSSQ